MYTLHRKFICTLYIESILKQGVEESMLGETKENILYSAVICINGRFVIVTLYQMWFKGSEGG